MPELKITYFDFPGRAEPLRLALTIAQIPFEDERLSPEQFALLKPTLPYGSLPILTVDDQVYAQSDALLRYCGILSGLYPDDPLQAARVDEIVYTVIDFVSGLEKITDDRLDDETLNYTRMREYLDTAIPTFIAGIQARFEKSSPHPWAVGPSITIADLAIYVCLLNIGAGAFDNVNLQPIQPFTTIMSCFNAVLNHPRVADWNAKIEAKVDALRRARYMAEQGAEEELHNRS